MPERCADTVGVEEEFLLVDAGSGRTVMRADAVLARVRDTALTRFHAELAGTQVEAATGPCTSAAKLGEELATARGLLADAAREEGLELLSRGTPRKAATHSVISPGARFHRILDAYAGVVEDYEACGCHVHVGVPDRETGVAVLGHVRPWLPTLLALSANSPDHGYASWRMVQQSRFPGSGVPPLFAGAADYDAHIARTVACGALVDAAQSFWLVRLGTKVPTVEFRVADAAAEVDDAVLQSALCRALVHTACQDVEAGAEPPAVRDDVLAAAVWTASRYGLDGAAVHPWRECRVPATAVLDELVSRVTPALEERGELALVLGLLDRRV
ncbi:YbdK family carboxylate-amine ligase [Lentzea sp. NBRC 102530]|uniref:carboxylate-amine ligase n=1 Tax=Lentzea sp. NBRC 102530 TaxID=3032201 RepID=UPI0024A33F29|nr:YbdK family carboxylate-amine ligase [Lentzea sp. NBRC 102530]GLY47801.1 putative glutamate--cysteine ligase 2 [Lentzea sp. NBRC 102530]